MYSSIQLIPLQQGIEQSFIVAYNDINVKIDLRFSDYNQYWFIDAYNNDTGAAIITGRALVLEQNVLENLDYLLLGALVLTDTEPDNTNEIDIKNDMGGRLKLYRAI